MISKFWKFALYFLIEHLRGEDVTSINRCADVTLLKENNKIYGLEGVFDSDRAPPKWETKYKSHVPIGQMANSSALGVYVPHGMTPDHYITTIWIEDKAGRLLGCKEILSDEDPKVTFIFPSHTESIIPFAHCSLHGVWKGNVVDQLKDLIAINSAYGKEGVFNENYYPLQFKKKLSTHIPRITVTPKYITIDVDHIPNEDHLVSMIWAEDQTGSIVAKASFSAPLEPVMIFSRLDAMSTITAFAYCNLHGVWSATKVLNDAGHAEL